MVTYNTIVKANRILNELARLDKEGRLSLPRSTRVKLVQGVRLVRAPYEEYVNEHNEIVTKYGTKNSRGIVEVKGGTPEFDLYTSEHTALLDTEVKGAALINLTEEELLGRDNPVPIDLVADMVDIGMLTLNS